MNIDLIDWGKADFMGLRYTRGGAITDTCFPVTRSTATKRGYNIERLHSDQGSEFKSQLKLTCKANRVEQTNGDPAHRTDSAVIENFRQQDAGVLLYCSSVALALTGLATAAQALDIISELVMHATKLIRLRSITPFQKQTRISSW